MVNIVRQTVTIVLGILTMVISALYIVFWNYSIYSSYTGSAVYGLLYTRGIKNTVAATITSHAFQIAIVVLTIIGVKYFLDACRSEKYQRMVSAGYVFMGIVSFLYLLGMFVTTFLFSRDNSMKKANTSYYMMIAFILLIIYAIYKSFIVKEKAYSFMNILLVAATVLSFLAGGVLRADAHYNIVGNDNYWAGKAVAVAIGITQSMPFIFLCYFEIFYMPDRIKYQKKLEEFIKDNESDKQNLKDTANA